MKPAEIRALSDAELLNELENAQQRLFNLHFQRTIQNLDSTADLSQARKDIARLQTILGQRAGRVRSGPCGDAGRGGSFPDDADRPRRRHRPGGCRPDAGRGGPGR